MAGFAVSANGRFSAVHRGANAGPKRFSSWEIHPVYAMDVCKFTTQAKCRVDRDSDWTSFEKWMEAIETDENQ
jgi:hypothetical protein